MSNPLKREKLAPGAHFSSISDPRYKFNRITFGFFVPLDEAKASHYALLVRYLSTSCGDIPVARDFTNYLASLYNAKCDFDIVGLGDTQFLGVSMTFMDDSYALHGEKIAEEASKVLFDCIFRPNNDGKAFHAPTVEIEKRIQIEEIEAELNEKRTYASNQAKRILFEGEPAAVYALGTVEKTREITPESLYKAHCDLLSTAGVEIICVGCNDFSDALRVAKERFAAQSMENRQYVACKSALSPPKAAVTERTETLPLLNQSKMVMGFKTASNAHATVMMCDMYGGTISSKLFLNVREKLSLCYYCWSQPDRLKGAMTVSSGVEEAKIDEAKAEILAQLECIKNGDFTDDELNNALLHKQNEFKSLSDSLSAMTFWYVKRIYDGDIKSPEEYIKYFEAVSREDIINAAKSMTLDTFYILSGTVGDDALGVPQKEEK